MFFAAAEEWCEARRILAFLHVASRCSSWTALVFVPVLKEPGPEEGVVC